MTRLPRRSVLRPKLATLMLLLVTTVPLIWVGARALLRDSARPSFSAGKITQVDQVISAAEANAISFWDGSHVELEELAKARVVTLADARVEVRLEQGAGHFVLEAAGERDWIVSAGPFRLYVQGADFRVGWEPSKGSFQLQFNSGNAKLLSACGQPPQLLRERSIIQFVCLEKTKGASLPKAADAGATPAQAKPPAAESPLSWQELAAAGNYETAFAKLRKTPPETQCLSWPATDLTQAADLAALAQEPKEAERLLGCVRSRFGQDEAASNAAYRLGKLLFENRPAEAAKWFAAYHRERPNGSLVAEVLGRQMQALVRAGDTQGARHVAEKYLERFAEGPFGAEAKALLKR